MGFSAKQEQSHKYNIILLAHNYYILNKHYLSLEETITRACYDYNKIQLLAINNMKWSMNLTTSTEQRFNIQLEALMICLD